MARSALQLALRAHGASGANLKQEIDDLASKGLLSPIMRDWSHNVRVLGNDSAHPSLDQQPTNAKDASDIVGFLDFLLEYLYTLPKRINEHRGRMDYHSADERRFITIGASTQRRLLLIAHADSGVDRVRVISARVATRGENHAYQERSAKRQ